MIVCLDVDYRTDAVVTACVAFEAWTADTATRELRVRTAGAAAAYAPGRFFERELPYLRAALDQLGMPIDIAIVDGYVWLGPGLPGLGAHLHAAIGTPVVGVAKTPYLSAPSTSVLRGASARPLHVTAEGIPAATAAAHVRDMHGPFRIPTLLKRADTLARAP